MTLSFAPERIEQTRRVFEQLDRARQGGLTIRKHEFLHALRSITEPEEASLDSLLETKILSSPKRPPIVPKTAARRPSRVARAGDNVCGGRRWGANSAGCPACSENPMPRLCRLMPVFASTRWLPKPDAFDWMRDTAMRRPSASMPAVQR